jgi:hypothetical protein
MLGMGMPAAAADPTRPVSTSENLGAQSIDGVPVEGRRTTTTYPAGSQGNDRPIVATSEIWMSLPRSVDKRWAEVGHRARRCDGEAVDWAFGETGAGKSGATPLHPAGDGGSVEWMIEAEDAQTLPHRIPVAV